MVSQVTKLAESPWQLADSLAQLTVGTLRCRVDLLHPAMGMHNIVWRDTPLTGNLLGVTTRVNSAADTDLTTEGMDRFIRGEDLVASFPQNEAQPFTLQIYWRVGSSAFDLVLVDAIVSLQTSLLECYPQVLLSTQLNAEEALLVANGDTSVAPIGIRVESSKSAAVLLRSANSSWSYLEMTHPADVGSWRVELAEDGQFVVRRELGGEFQEKGVIRRMRIRGSLLPRLNDIEVARRLFAEFEAAPPPLTT